MNKRGYILISITFIILTLSYFKISSIKVHILKNTNEMNLRLKDLLEENVDEKYYISQERVEELISKTKDGLFGKLPSFENSEPLEMLLFVDSELTHGTKFELKWSFVNQMQ